MKLSSEALTAELSAPGGVKFGGIPYGLELLFLPPTSDDDAERNGPLPEPLAALDPATLCPTLLGGADTAKSGTPAPGRTANEVGARTYWFRWITGHQVSFVLWKLLAREMRWASRSQGGEQADAIAAAAAYTRGCCAMVLYTGSCPRNLYEALIRPSMFLQHPGFSGTWAPDFAPVRNLFRNPRQFAPGNGPTAKQLRSAIELYRVIHAGVAERLVPSGASLLQAAPPPDSQQVPTQADLFDNYFRTLRARTSATQTVVQLLRRIEAVARDLTVNGLYAAGESGLNLPPDPKSAAVIECERDMFGVLLPVVEYATRPEQGETGLGTQSA